MDLALSDIASNVPSEYKSEIIEEGKILLRQMNKFQKSLKNK